MTMRIKIATAMHERARTQMTGLPRFDRLPAQIQVQALEMVDACLDALLKPTPEMCDEGWGLDAADDKYCAEKTFVWMIEAAKEGK